MKHEAFFAAIAKVVEGVCAYPDQLRCFTERLNGADVLVFMPHMADYPKLIGRKGRQVKAFESLFQMAAVRNNAPIAVAFRESFEGHREPPDPWVFKPQFDHKGFRAIVDAICSFAFGETQVEITEDAERIVLFIGGDQADECAPVVNAILYPYVYAKGRKLKLRNAIPELSPLKQ